LRDAVAASRTRDRQEGGAQSIGQVVAVSAGVFAIAFLKSPKLHARLLQLSMARHLEQEDFAGWEGGAHHYRDPALLALALVSEPRVEMSRTAQIEKCPHCGKPLAKTARDLMPKDLGLLRLIVSMGRARGDD
jgi:hypothetical protein